LCFDEPGKRVYIKPDEMVETRAERKTSHTSDDSDSRRAAGTLSTDDKARRTNPWAYPLAGEDAWETLEILRDRFGEVRALQLFTACVPIPQASVQETALV
jgi:hypothetical protein